MSVMRTFHSAALGELTCVQWNQIVEGVVTQASGQLELRRGYGHEAKYLVNGDEDM